MVVVKSTWSYPIDDIVCVTDCAGDNLRRRIAFDLPLPAALDLARWLDGLKLLLPPT